MIKSLLKAFKPFVCPGCGDPSAAAICSVCVSTMKKNREMLLPQEDGIRGIFPLFISFHNTHSVLKYWKNHGGSDLRKFLFNPEEELLFKMRDLNFDALVPIPQNQSRNLKRGHSSALEVARFFSNLLDAPVEYDWLKLKPESNRKQALLNEWERRFLDSPFEWGAIESANQQTTKRILIVDDFITTGSTLVKAANTLMAGMQDVEVYAASLSWKPKTGPQRQGRSRSIGSGREFQTNHWSKHQSSSPEDQNVLQSARAHE